MLCIRTLPEDCKYIGHFMLSWTNCICQPRTSSPHEHSIHAHPRLRRHRLDIITQQCPAQSHGVNILATSASFIHNAHSGSSRLSQSNPNHCSRRTHTDECSLGQSLRFGRGHETKYGHSRGSRLRAEKSGDDVFCFFVCFYALLLLVRLPR